jgi:CubicO group peptidase (beta-lactamase class C family)
MKRWMKVRLLAVLGIAASVRLALPAQSAEAPAASSPRLQQKYGPKLAAFEAMVRKQMAADHTTGLAIAFLEGEDVWARAFGLADVENGSPAKLESSFRLASITKPMTATAVLQLAEKGRIDLDAEIQTYVPYFPRKKYPVTVRQLLGHLGGITHYKNREKELHIKEHMDTRQAIAIFADYDLVAEPGTKYSYSTYGFNLLGAAIETASGQSYGDYMRDHIWAPLGMKDTRMDDPREIIPNRVRGYEWVDGKLRNSEFVDISSRFAGGGTRTTVLDMLKFARGFMDGRLLSKTSLDQMTQKMTLADGRYTEDGLGWGLLPINGHYVLAHSGAQNETRTLLFILPARHTAIAAATNFESGDLFWYVQALVAQVLDEHWDRSGGSAAYLPDRVDRAQFFTARNVFQSGLSEYERRGRATIADPGRLREAFAYFNRCADRKALEGSLAASRKKCADGLHPLAGEPLPAVGSFMAMTLAEHGGAARLDGYHASGPMAFFQDYIRTYHDAPGIPRELRFDAGLEKRVARWSKDWARTFNERTRGPFVASGGLDALGLGETLAGASVYPDLISELSELTLQHCADGDRVHALEAASLSAALYPDAAAATVALAGAHVCFDESGEARALLQKARAMEGGEEAAGSQSLNGMAYELAGLGRMDGATALLRIATELYPKAANLYDSLGELELKAGHTEASIAAYEKALDIDPKLESSIRALEAIRKTKP